jgi:hypothetical protein
MRRLTDAERCALRTYGPPGEGPVPDSVFRELEALGWGRWELDPTDGKPFWLVTEAGELALRLDDAARSA